RRLRLGRADAALQCHKSRSQAISQMRGIVATALCHRALTRSNARAPRHSEAATTFVRSPIASRILLLLRTDHGCNRSCARMAGSWPVAWVGFDDDHLKAVATDYWARLGDRACGHHINVAGNGVRRVAAVTWVA